MIPDVNEQETLKALQSLLDQIKNLSADLQETITALKDETESHYLKLELLPDYVDIKILKKYLKVGINRIYELTKSPGFPHPIPYANGKKIFAKAEIKEWLEEQRKIG